MESVTSFNVCLLFVECMSVLFLCWCCVCWKSVYRLFLYEFIALYVNIHIFYIYVSACAYLL